MLLVVGCGEAGHMGSYMARAASVLRIPCTLMDTSQAETGNRYVQKFYWQFRGKRPVHLRRFARWARDVCDAQDPKIVLTTGGRVPLDTGDIRALKSKGIKVINYSTDDPWNPRLRAPYFISTLADYDAVFTPRRSNIADFQRCGVPRICYLPFAYDSDTHRPWLGPSLGEGLSPSDVMFVGGCDADRLPILCSLAEAGLTLALFGGYWDLHASTRPFSRGIVSQDAIRAASGVAKTILCLVRRANRDGHSMRSFEAAAIGGCIIAEDTPDHRELFGPDGHAACYFGDTDGLVRTVKLLVDDPDRRNTLAMNLRKRMRERSDTYKDRLLTMFKAAIGPRSEFSEPAYLKLEMSDPQAVPQEQQF
jgi:spore maturation protein CgeB